MRKTIATLSLVLLFIAASAQNQPKLQIGQEAPVLQFNKCLDKNLPSDFYKNKILVLDFWATWCAPCIASFPHFNNLSTKFKSDKVVFATITDEPALTASTFFSRTKKEVAALRLIDTSKVTSKTFGAVSIPFCVVIDASNKVRWTGNTADLTEQLLQDIISTPNLPKQPEIKAPEQKAFVATTTSAKPAIYFQFQATKGVEGGRFGGSNRGGAQSDFFAIDRYNTRLGDFLGELAGYSSAARFTTNDSLKLKQMVNITYTSPWGKGYEEFAADYAGRFIPKMPRTNYLIFLLQSTFKFDLTVTEKEADVYELVITDEKKLANFKSLQKGHSSFSDDYFPKFEIVGYPLHTITTQLETSFKKIIVDNLTGEDRYDLSLDISNLTTLNRTLAFHGLQLKPVTTAVKKIDINFK